MPYVNRVDEPVLYYPVSSLNSPAIPITERNHRYKQRSLNMGGPPPRYFGPSPFTSPYSHLLETQPTDRNGKLGPFEWTIHAQKWEPNKLPLHRAFAYRVFDGLPEFNPHVHCGRDPKGTRDTMFLLASYLGKIVECHESLKTAQQAFIEAYRSLKFALVIAPNVSYLLGDGWRSLLATACRPLPWWELSKVVNELRRRLVEAAAWCELHSRALVWNLAYRKGNVLPKWPTDDRLVGLFVDEEDPKSLELGEGLALLGLPVWAIREIDKYDDSARLDTSPPGHQLQTPAWKRALEVAENELGPPPSSDPNKAHSRRLIQRAKWLFSDQLERDVQRGLAQPPIHRWWRVGEQNLANGPFFVPYPPQPLRFAARHPRKKLVEILSIVDRHFDENAQLTPNREQVFFQVAHFLNDGYLPVATRKEFDCLFPRWNVSNLHLREEIGAVKLDRALPKLDYDDIAPFSAVPPRLIERLHGVVVDVADYLPPVPQSQSPTTFDPATYVEALRRLQKSRLSALVPEMPRLLERMIPQPASPLRSPSPLPSIAGPSYSPPHRSASPFDTNLASSNFPPDSLVLDSEIDFPSLPLASRIAPLPSSDQSRPFTPPSSGSRVRSRSQAMTPSPPKRPTRPRLNNQSLPNDSTPPPPRSPRQRLIDRIQLPLEPSEFLEQEDSQLNLLPPRTSMALRLDEPSLIPSDPEALQALQASVKTASARNEFSGLPKILAEEFKARWAGSSEERCVVGFGPVSAKSPWGKLLSQVWFRADEDDWWKSELALYQRFSSATGCQVFMEEDKQDPDQSVYLCWIEWRGKGSIAAAARVSHASQAASLLAPSLFPAPFSPPAEELSRSPEFVDWNPEVRERATNLAESRRQERFALQARYKSSSDEVDITSIFGKDSSKQISLELEQRWRASRQSAGAPPQPCTVLQTPIQRDAHPFPGVPPSVMSRHEVGPCQLVDLIEQYRAFRQEDGLGEDFDELAKPFLAVVTHIIHTASKKKDRAFRQPLPLSGELRNMITWIAACIRQDDQPKTLFRISRVSGSMLRKLSCGASNDRLLKSLCRT